MRYGSMTFQVWEAVDVWALYGVNMDGGGGEHEEAFVLGAGVAH